MSTLFKVGDRVKDQDGDTGTVIEVEDAHNVHVALDDNGFGQGRGIYCQEPSCAEFSPLSIITP